MKCPFCDHPETKVIDSRESNEEPEIRRRRECLKCEKRFTTYETVEYPELFVIKNDGTKQLFDRTKVLRGIAKACEKRNINPEEIENLAREVENKVRSKLAREVTSRYIGQLISRRLYKIDVVAYIRFLSVYQNFNDLNSFIKIITKVVEDEKLSKDEKDEAAKLLKSASVIVGSD